MLETSLSECSGFGIRRSFDPDSVVAVHRVKSHERLAESRGGYFFHPYKRGRGTLLSWVQGVLYFMCRFLTKASFMALIRFLVL